MGTFTGISRLLASADKSQDLATLHFHMTTIGWSSWVFALCKDHVPPCSSAKPASLISPARFLEAFAFVTPDRLFPEFSSLPHQSEEEKSPPSVFSQTQVCSSALPQASFLSLFGMWFPYILRLLTRALHGSSRSPLQPFPIPQNAFQKTSVG